MLSVFCVSFVETLQSYNLFRYVVLFTPIFFSFFAFKPHI